jgi:hypothetical protein
MIYYVSVTGLISQVFGGAGSEASLPGHPGVPSFFFFPQPPAVDEREGKMRRMEVRRCYLVAHTQNK